MAAWNSINTQEIGVRMHKVATVVLKKIWCHDRIEQHTLWECVCIKLVIGICQWDYCGYYCGHARSQRFAITITASIRSEEENMETYVSYKAYKKKNPKSSQMFNAQTNRLTK